MATNIIFQPGYKQSVVCSSPASPVSGDPVRYGNMTGIAMTDEGEGGNSSTKTSVDFGPFIADLSVKGIDGSGNSPVAVGDALWYVDADTPHLSKKSSGYFYGIALEAVDSAATTTIQVLHIPSPGTGTLAAGSIGATQLASAAVTAAKLSSTLVKGFIPLPLQDWREVATNAIQNAAANGGLLASDTTPILERVNGATDKQLRLDWAASNSDEIVFGGIALPPDLDDASAITIHVLAAMAGAADTPTLALSYFEGVGDSNAGGNTAAVTGTAVAEYSVTVAAGNVGAHPNVITVGITPGAHTTDALYIYAAWIEYTRQ